MEKRGPSSCYDGVIKRASEIDIAVLDRVEDHLIDSRVFQANFVRRKENFSSFVLFRSQFDILSIGQEIVGHDPIILHALVGPIASRRDRGNETEPFLDFLHNFKLGRRVENVTRSSQQQHQVIRHVSASHVYPSNRVVH